MRRAAELPPLTPRPVLTPEGFLALCRMPPLQVGVRLVCRCTLLSWAGLHSLASCGLQRALHSSTGLREQGRPVLSGMPSWAAASLRRPPPPARPPPRRAPRCGCTSPPLRRCCRASCRSRGRCLPWTPSSWPTRPPKRRCSGGVWLQSRAMAGIKGGRGWKRRAPGPLAASAGGGKALLAVAILLSPLVHAHRRWPPSPVPHHDACRLPPIQLPPPSGGWRWRFGPRAWAWLACPCCAARCGCAEAVAVRGEWLTSGGGGGQREGAVAARLCDHGSARCCSPRAPGILGGKCSMPSEPTAPPGTPPAPLPPMLHRARARAPPASTTTSSRRSRCTTT